MNALSVVYQIPYVLQGDASGCNAQSGASDSPLPSLPININNFFQSSQSFPIPPSLSLSAANKSWATLIVGVAADGDHVDTHLWRRRRRRRRWRADGLLFAAAASHDVDDDDDDDDDDDPLSSKISQGIRLIGCFDTTSTIARENGLHHEEDLECGYFMEWWRWR